MSTNQLRRATSSYKFKSYSKITSTANSAKHKDYVAVLVDGILRLVDDAVAVAAEVQIFLASKKTQQHIHAGKRIPIAILRRIKTVQAKLDSAFVCFQRGAQTEIENQEVEKILRQMNHAATEMLQVVESLSVFARNNIVSRLNLIQKKLQWIVGNAETARLSLIPYTKAAAIATLPKNPKIVAPPTATRALFDDPDPTPLAPFFEKAQQRGWRVKEKQLAEETGEAVDEGLEDSFELIARLQKPTEGLLDDAVIVGVVQFPVISLNARRIPESIIQECIHPTLGYDFYLVLGDYIVIDKMCLLGIHHTIMRIQDENKRPKLDIDKFVELHPFLVTEQPEWAHILNQTHPIQPAKREGSHYYCPLVPNAIAHKWGLGIGNWDFLAE